MYSRTISCFASSRALASSVLLAPAFARASMSAHLLVLERPGAESHFFLSESFNALSGRSWRRRSVFSGEDQGSWAERMSVWKWSLRMSRLRLR